MKMQESGKLYVVATPIGNLADITQRAKEILAAVNVIAAEDTRHSKKLLQHFHIHTPMLPLHQDNERKQTQHLLKRMFAGESVALISDAGTPLVSDPGIYLVNAALDADIPVVPIPGPCAAITALSAAGLSSAGFIFAGFLSTKPGPRQKQLEKLRHEQRTLIFYEAPHRLMALIEAMLAIFGAERTVVLAKELTKTFETIHRAKLRELQIWLQEDEKRSKGEFVILVQGAEKSIETDITETTQRVLDILLTELPMKQAVALAAKITGEKRNRLYQLALQKMD